MADRGPSTRRVKRSRKRGRSAEQPSDESIASGLLFPTPSATRHRDHAERSAAKLAATSQTLQGFGVDALNPYPNRPIEMIGGKTSTQLRDGVRQGCPPVPGVYGMFDPHGELIYVGKSQSLRHRLLSYFSQTAKNEKGGRIIDQTRAIQWETQPSDFAARVREMGLIRRWTPRMNVQGVPQRQRPVYIVLGRKPAEMFYLSTSPPVRHVVAVEGPFYGVNRMNRVIDVLNKTFGLRDCSQQTVFQFAEQMSLFELQPRPGCLRMEIGNCLGPCAAGCTRDEYLERVNAAESFLDGFNDEPLVMVQETMESAAENRQYELAARARDSLTSLQYASRKLGLLANARQNYSFIYASKGYDGQTIWYLIRRGEIIDVMAAPKSRERFDQSKPQLQAWSAMLRKKYQRLGSEHPHTVPIVAAWFRKHRGEIKQTFAPEKAGHRYHRAKHVA